MTSLLVLLTKRTAFQSNLRLPCFLAAFHLSVPSSVLQPLVPAVTVYFISSFLTLSFLSLAVASHHSLHGLNSFHRFIFLHILVSSSILSSFSYTSRGLLFISASDNHATCNSRYTPNLSFHLICHPQRHFYILPTFLAAFQAFTLFFFFHEHYKMSLHAYVNAVRNSLKDNVHLTDSAPVIVSATIWSSPLVLKLLWSFLPYPSFKTKQTICIPGSFPKFFFL